MHVTITPGAPFQRFLLLLSLLLVPAFFSTPALAREKKCPSEESLTLNARIALVEAQKLTQETKGNPNGDKVAQATKILETFCEKYPDEHHPYVNFTLAGLYLEKNKLAPALVQFQKSVALCPQFTAAWQNLGKLAFDLQKYEMAAHALEQAWALTEPKRHPLLYHAAAALVSAEKPGPALEHMIFLTSGQAGDPEESWVKLFVHLSMELKKTRAAIKTVERLLAQNDPGAYLFRLATTLYLDQSRYKEAAKALSAYGMITPLTPREQMLLADLYNNLGLPYKAAHNYEKISNCPVTGAKNTPTNRQKLYERMAASWMDACEPDKALCAADKGLEHHPKCHGLWKLKGWIYYGKEDFSKAAVAFARATKLKKSDTRSLFMQGLCASRAGQKKEAKKILALAARDKNFKKQALGLIQQMEMGSDPS